MFPFQVVKESNVSQGMAPSAGELPTTVGTEFFKLKSTSTVTCVETDLKEFVSNHETGRTGNVLSLIHI